MNKTFSFVLFVLFFDWKSVIVFLNVNMTSSQKVLFYTKYDMILLFIIFFIISIIYFKK